MAEISCIRPQPGYQEKVLTNPADIVISGAAAYVGKTYGLLLEAVRNVNVPRYGGVIFRRTSVQIRNEGGLWDTSKEIYGGMRAEPKESTLEWVFRGGTKIKFSHLEYEKNIYDWQGAQIAFIGFDELTHFTEKMFFYLLSRNRSLCGVDPYVRATCNPDPDSWVATLIEWWIDPETGFPIPERDGAVRYFIKNGANYIWGDSREEVEEKAWFLLEPLISESGLLAKDFIKSLSFVSGSIYDNKRGLEVNPGYLGNLLSQDEQTQAQLLYGNWKIKVSDQDIYDYYAFVGMFDNVMEVDREFRFITADIALEGSDKFIVGYWEGKSLEDILIMNKSKGPEVIEGIERFAKAYKVQNRNICYDNDGIGGFVGGFISGSIPFRNGSTALPDPVKRKDPENYKNLKTQCFYRSGKAVERGEYKISKRVASMMYDDKMTVRQRLIHERKAIKKAPKDDDGKLCIIKKDEMKTMINGQSPDLMDMLMMREWFDLAFKFKVVVA
jgi:hypothetical protein